MTYHNVRPSYGAHRYHPNGYFGGSPGRRQDVRRITRVVGAVVDVGARTGLLDAEDVSNIASVASLGGGLLYDAGVISGDRDLAALGHSTSALSRLERYRARNMGRMEAREARQREADLREAGREGDRIVDGLAPLINNIVAIAREPQSPEQQERLRIATQQYRDAAASFTGGDSRTAFLIPRNETITVNGRTIYLPAGPANADTLLQFAIDRSTGAPEPDRDRDRNPDTSDTRTQPSPPTFQSNGEDLALTPNQTIDAPTALRLLTAPNVTENGQPVSLAARLNKVVAAGNTDLQAHIQSGDPQNAWIVKNLMGPNVDPAVAGNIRAMYASMSEPEKATYRQQMQHMVDQVATTLPVNEQAAFRQRAAAMIDPSATQPDNSGTPAPTPPQFQGDGSTAALDAAALEPGTMTAATAAQLLKATTVTVGGQQLSLGARFNKAFAAGITQMRAGHPEILRSFTDPANQSNVAAMYAGMSTDEKQEFDRIIAAGREGLTGQAAADYDAAVARLREGVQNQPGNGTPQGPQQSFMDMLKEFFEKLITALETAFGTPGQTPPGQTPPGQTPPGQTPPGQTPPGQTPPGQTPPGQTPPGQTPPGQTPPGQTPPGQTPPGQTPPGQTPPGQTPPGQTPQASAVLESAVAHLSFSGDQTAPGTLKRGESLETIVAASMSRDRVAHANPQPNNTIDQDERPYYEAMNRVFGMDSSISMNPNETAAFQAALRQAKAQGIEPDQFVSALVHDNDPGHAAAVQIATAARDQHRPQAAR